VTTMTGELTTDHVPGPHRGQPVLLAGEPLQQARAALLLLHGRGADAEDILELAQELQQPGYIFLAPRAAHQSWYPNRFLAPLESNEPHLSSALALVETLLTQLAAAGIPAERTLLLGFSQGACLALEFVARNARRYAGVAGLSGGLIGPDATARDDTGSLAGTPVFLGCSTEDPHIPRQRVLESAGVLRRLGAVVTTRLYPHLGHTVNRNELRFIQGMMKAALA
jgi:phospholipase/carboxylesterase